MCCLEISVIRLVQGALEVCAFKLKHMRAETGPVEVARKLRERTASERIPK